MSVLVQQRLITEQDPFPINQAKFHTSKSILTDFVLKKLKLSKTNFTKPYESITYKGSNKANAQHH